jgi:hypothetical protein
MKNKIYTIFLLGFSLFLLSTCKNPEIGYETFAITDESIEPDMYGVKVNGFFSFSGNVQEMKMKIATNESLTDAADYSIIIDNQTFSGEIDGLEPNTTYYYCYNIDFGWKDDYLTETNSFTTLKGLPTVKTLETIALYDASFRIKCEVTSDGGSDIMERGIYWCIGNTDDNHPNLGDNKIIHDENGVGEYFCLMDNLEPNTTYSVKAYAKNSIGISLAQEVLHFKTHDNPSDSLMIVTDCNPLSGGTATGGGTFTYGQRCTVTATANEGYAFKQWTENGNQVSTEASYTFTVDRNRTLVANFTLNTYSITAIADPEAGGMVSGANTYNYGALCTLTATANTGYTFVNWTKNGAQVSTDASYIFTVTAAEEYVALFQPKTYTISVSADPSDGGIVTGNGNYTYGQNCTVTATANSGYVFSHWAEGGITVSSNASYTFVVNGNRNLVAKFDQTFPVGAINGRFTINPDGDQVYFSKGNLQYIGSASTPYWKFADKQWSYLGNHGQGSENQQADRDLFGWGTSGWNCGNKFYQPYDTDISSGEFYGPGNNNDLTGQYANSDWGYYNAIFNGGETSGLWRTLSNSEWNYVFFERNTPSGILFAKAIVSGVNGIIILPDTWNSSYNLSAVNNQGAAFVSNVISDSEWTNKLEKNGAVFLPVAGWRFGHSVTEEGSKGYYWTSSHHDTIDNTSFSLSIADGAFSTNQMGRHAGLSVRLVYPIP